VSHHGFEAFDEGPDFQRRNERIRALLSSTAEFRGAIGAYPAGKLTATDEGSIQFAIGEKDGKVVIDFGTPVSWLGMTAQEAADLASAIFQRARLVGRRNGETIAINIGG
jgi:hypothetical protein